MLTNMRGLFIGVVVLGACYGQIVPLYEAQSDLTSGTLVAAGSIGVVALAGRAGPLWLEIHWHIQKNYLKKKKNKSYVLQQLPRWRHCLSAGIQEIAITRQQRKLQRSSVLIYVKIWSQQRMQNMKRKKKVLD